MNRIRLVLGILALLFAAPKSNAQPARDSSLGTFSGWSTNGPGVYRVYRRATQGLPGPVLSYMPPSTNLPPDLRRGLMMFRVAADSLLVAPAVPVFDHLAAQSLNNVIWTNFIAHTNGRNMAVWNVRSHPPGWPAKPPVIQWNSNSLLWGMKGITALSPCWEMEGSSGQVPITALTRRHGYTRGHSMGADGFRTRYAGKKVWFVTEDNTVVQMTVKREVVRTSENSSRDYSIVLFSSDLPDTIQPMRVVAQKEVFGPHSKYVYFPESLCPIFKTEQVGYVSADVPGFTLDTFKGGDSGSPNMVPLPGELVFWTGRSTSGASPEMQADMDELSRLEGLDPAKYQLQWVDLSAYPTY